MKLSVQQIIHFDKAAAKVMQFVNDELNKIEAGPQREKVYEVYQAAMAVQNMAQQLVGAEVTVKG